MSNADWALDAHKEGGFDARQGRPPNLADYPHHGGYESRNYHRGYARARQEKMEADHAADPR